MIDKPVGISSFSALAKVRRLWRENLISNNLSPKKAKIGHTGTLDPAASGLLILVLGGYTKRAQEFSKLDKTYNVEMLLGSVSTTGDREGSITKISSKEPTQAEIGAVIEQFIGVMEQTPPIYSAIKHNGVRAYKLARQGKEVVLKPRPVRIDSIDQLSYAYPKLSFTARVGSGTYVRSLVEDIGAALDTGAYMSALRRTSVGNFSIEQSINIDNLEYSDLIRHIRLIKQK